MSDDELRIIATTALKTILGHRPNALTPPTTSMELLTKIMTTKLPSSLFPTSSKPIPRFRLTDLHKLENILEGLSQPLAWDDGYISVSRDKDTNEMTIWEIGLGPRKVSAGTKRKRVIDEEADSAAGSAGEEEDEANAAGGSGWARSTLGGLSKEMRDVYALLQRGTAKGKLLAEQVSSIPMEVTLYPNGCLIILVPFSQRRVRTHMCPHNQRRLCQSPTRFLSQPLLRYTNNL